VLSTDDSAAETENLITVLGEAVKKDAQSVCVRTSHRDLARGKWDPRRLAWSWWWPMWLWLRWQGYARIWRGDLTPTGTTVGPWTPELLYGLEGQQIKLFVKKVDGVDRPGEIWVKVNGSRWTLLLFIVVYLSIRTWV
jgi:hypothetical protein